MAARRRGETGPGTGEGPGTGLGYEAPLSRTTKALGDTWQSAARDALTVILRRIEEIAGGSGDVGELLRAAERVGEVVAAAETLEGGS